MLKHPSDSAARQAAVDPERSFLVQAPAGSGKTEVLTDRILALLATVNRPEEIIAITFTRKAAAEMRARVLSKLAAGGGPPPQEPHRLASWELARKALQRNDDLGWRLLQHPARLAVRTIDAFCTQLVRSMPWLSALGGMPGLVDNADAHYEAAARATLAMVDEHEDVARLIQHLDVDLNTATTMLSDMLGQRDQWLPLLAAGSDPARLLDTLDDVILQDLEALSQAMPTGWANDLGMPLRHAAEALAQDGKHDLYEALQDWDGTSFDDCVTSVSRWQALAQILLTNDGALRKSLNKNQGCPPKSSQKDALTQWLKAMDADAAWIELLHRARCIPASGYSRDQHETLAAFIQVLWLASAQLQLRFSDAGEVDFIEVAQRAVQALGDDDDPTDLLLILDNQIRHILVDEFQDTSQSQIDLLTRLTAGWQQGDGRTLFLVGDPMQSIYRFRKAEVGWFLHVKQHGLGSVQLEPLQLTDNFRSLGKLVHTVNRLCAPIFPRNDLPALGAIRYTPSTPFNNDASVGQVSFHPVWAPKEAGSQSAAIVDDIVDDTVVDLARQALVRYSDSPHPVAILVRARNHLNQVVRRLSQEGLPCRAVDLVKLQSRQAVSDVVQLARALAHPGDRLAWLSVLRSPLCGLKLDTLHQLFGRDHDSSVPTLLKRWLTTDEAKSVQGDVKSSVSRIDVSEAWRLRRVAAILLDAGNRSGRLPFAAWLYHCWKQLQGPAIYPSVSDHSDIESVLRLIEKLAPYGNLNPAELEASLDSLYAAPRSSGRAIEVMTIHKAKGLEFEAVILTGLCRKGRSDRPSLIQVEQSEGRVLLGPIKRSADDAADPVSHYLMQREKERAAFELDRLLYVALTRARSELHMVATVKVDDGGQTVRPSSSSLLARLWDHIDRPDPASAISADGALVNSATQVQRLLVRPALTALSELQDADAGVERRADAPAPGLPSTQKASLAVSWAWRDQGHDERLLGTVAHAWLERIGREGIAAWPLDRLDGSMTVFRKQLSRAGITASRLDDATTVLHETLTATLRSDKGRWLLHAARAYREWTLLDLSGRVSIIDLAISQQQSWLVVDYKTSMPAANETHDEFASRMRAIHQDQLARYCAQVHALDGRKAHAALFFPRADLWVEC